MRLLRLPAMAALLTLILGAVAPDPVRASDSLLDQVPDSIFNPETFTLDNGMEVVVIPNRRAPVVVHMVWYKAGSADDPRGKSGLAHYLEHLMFKGTENTPSGAFSETVARLGGRENAFTSFDYTAYFQTVAREHLETVMRLEADRMANLTIGEEEALTERDVILEERRQVIDAQPERRLNEAVDTVLLAGSAYATPIIGWERDMATLTRADARAFYETWYAPNNAILIVSGDIDADELRPLAEATYGAIPPKEGIPDRLRPPPHPLDIDAVIRMRDDEISEPRFRHAFNAPETMTNNQPDTYAMTVLQNILSSTTSSRLFRRLVVEERLATNVFVRFNDGFINSAELTLGGTPAGGVPVERLEAAVHDEIRAVLAEGITAEQVAEAQERLLGQTVFAQDSLFFPARIFGAELSQGRSIEDVEQWPSRSAAVTADDVNRVANEILGDLTGGIQAYLLPDQAPDIAPEPTAASEEAIQ